MSINLAAGISLCCNSKIVSRCWDNGQLLGLLALVCSEGAVVDISELEELVDEEDQDLQY